MKFNYKMFAKAIIDYRKNIGLRELGKQMKVSPSTLSRILNGKKSDIDSILKICTWLKKPITNFISK